jgi:rod shape-determining protein MreC
MARATRVGSVFDNSLLGICLLGSLAFLLLPSDMRDRSAAALRRTVVAPLASLQRRAELSRAAFMSYGERTERAGELAQIRADNVALQSENRRLRELLGLGGRLAWGFVVAEASPAQLETGLVHQQILQTFSVTAGSRVGVQLFTPVASDEGLVGMVQTVDQNSAIAISYAHPDFRVSASTPNDSAFGIVQASLYPGTRGKLEIRGVAFRSPLRRGQLIISSGLGGTYPRGIPVGTVISEIVTPEKWARTYLLEPAASLANIGPVFLLLKKRVDAGVPDVWTSMTAADSAARAIKATADSLARQAAMREMEARRAAMDSLRDSTLTDSTARRLAVPGAAPTPGAPTGTPTVPPAGVPARPPAAQTPTRPAGATTRPPGTPADTTTRRPTVPRPTVPRPTVPVPSGATGGQARTLSPGQP